MAGAYGRIVWWLVLLVIVGLEALLGKLRHAPPALLPLQHKMFLLNLPFVIIFQKSFRCKNLIHYILAAYINVRYFHAYISSCY